MTASKSAQEQTARAIDDIVRAQWGRLLSSLISTLRDFQLAEDCLQDAIVSALHHWSRHGLPRSPAGWLLQTARRKAIDRIRRDRNFERKRSEYQVLIDMEQETPDSLEDSAIPDERLRLIFSCCHPALEEKSRIALTLRTLGGLTTGEIARAFLDKEETMAQRLVRAKRKIKLAGIPFAVPDAEAWPGRLASVLSVLYLIFNEGYAASDGDALVRRNLCDEAIRLTRITLQLRGGEPEIMGLLALMILHDSRRETRTTTDGQFVPLENQDRTKWNSCQIKEGMALIEQALPLGALGPYQLQAAISAIHAEAKRFSDTRWDEIVVLYDLLNPMQPNPVIRLNRAAAISYAQSPDVALDILMSLRSELETYQPFHATLADCLSRAGQHQKARDAYSRAIELSTQPGEKTFLASRKDQLPA